MRILGMVLALVAFASQANADVILSIGSGTFAADSGLQTINIFARSTTAESTDFLVADFRIEAGTLGTPAGTFGGAGFIGAGNLQGTSSFLRDAGDSRVGNLSLDFTALQALPTVDGLLATLSINTAGLAAGTYTIVGENFATLAGNNNVSNGSFTIITAVPEPTSMALLGIAAGGLAVRRVWNKRRKA